MFVPTFWSKGDTETQKPSGGLGWGMVSTFWDNICLGRDSAGYLSFGQGLFGAWALPWALPSSSLATLVSKVLSPTRSVILPPRLLHTASWHFLSLSSLCLSITPSHLYGLSLAPSSLYPVDRTLTAQSMWFITSVTFGFFKLADRIKAPVGQMWSVGHNLDTPDILHPYTLWYTLYKMNIQ